MHLVMDRARLKTIEYRTAPYKQKVLYINSYCIFICSQAMGSTRQRTRTISRAVYETQYGNKDKDLLANLTMFRVRTVRELCVLGTSVIFSAKKLKSLKGTQEWEFFGFDFELWWLFMHK